MLYHVRLLLPQRYRRIPSRRERALLGAPPLPLTQRPRLVYHSCCAIMLSIASSSFANKPARHGFSAVASSAKVLCSTSMASSTSFSVTMRLGTNRSVFLPHVRKSTPFSRHISATFPGRVAFASGRPRMRPVPRTSEGTKLGNREASAVSRLCRCAATRLTCARKSGWLMRDRTWCATRV